MNKVNPIAVVMIKNTPLLTKRDNQYGQLVLAYYLSTTPNFKPKSKSLSSIGYLFL